MVKMKIDINIEPNLGIHEDSAQTNAKRDAKFEGLDFKKTTPKEGFEPEQRRRG
jgi:hypothetical protein